MTGAELIGQEELKEIQELFEREKVILYRYGPNNYKTVMFEEAFAEYMGVNYAHAADRMYIDKYHYDNYYQQFKWIKKISLKYPKLNIIIKHHAHYKGDQEEEKIIENCNVKTVYETQSINFSYDPVLKRFEFFKNTFIT